nr:hypothetical protein [Acidobacteriota bacterium]
THFNVMHASLSAIGSDMDVPTDPCNATIAIETLDCLDLEVMPEAQAHAYLTLVGFVSGDVAEGEPIPMTETSVVGG